MCTVLLLKLNNFDGLEDSFRKSYSVYTVEPEFDI